MNLNLNLNKNKNILLMPFVILLLAACDDDVPRTLCELTEDTHKREEIFMKCLDKAGYARKSVSYTADDDEDYDDVIYACGTESRHLSPDRYIQCKTYVYRSGAQHILDIKTTDTYKGENK